MTVTLIVFFIQWWRSEKKIHIFFPQFYSLFKPISEDVSIYFFFYKKLTDAQQIYATAKWLALLWKWCACLSHMFVLPYIHHKHHFFNSKQNGGFAYVVCMNMLHIKYAQIASW